jgi:hypothetical protein
MCSNRHHCTNCATSSSSGVVGSFSSPYGRTSHVPAASGTPVIVKARRQSASVRNISSKTRRPSSPMSAWLISSRWM